MIKRISALLICVLLFLTCIATVPTFAQASDITLLTDLGIIKPIQKTGLIKKSYSRGDFAASLVLMDATEPVSWTVYADDLNELAADINGNVNADSIAEVLASGYMKTDDEKCFRPGGNLSLDVALEALIRVLGYNELVKTNGGTVSAYYDMAIKIGLLKGVNVDDANKLSQEETAALLANAMSTRLYSDGKLLANNGCFYDFWNLTKRSGKLLANSNLGIAVAKTSYKKVNINGTIYSTDLLIADELVGSDVLFYTTDKNGYEEIISIYAKSKGNSKSISADDIRQIEDEGSVITITDKNEEEFDIAKTGFAIVNGKTLTPSVSIFDAFRSGNMTLVDSDSDGEFDIAHMTLMKQAVIDGVNSEYGTLQTKFDGDTINIFDVDTYEVYLNNKAAEFSALKNGMIVGIACDNFTIDNTGEIIYDYQNSDRICLYASSHEAIGTVFSIKQDEVMLDDMTYTFGPAYDRLVLNGHIQPLKAGDGVKVYLDMFGQIAYYEIDSSINTTHYGYLIATDCPPRGLDRTMRIRLMDSNGDFHIYKVAEKFTLDGAQVDSGSLQYLVGSETVDLTERQVIRYRVANDLVRSIDTKVLRAGVENSDLSLTEDIAFDPSVSGNSKYEIRSGVIDRKVAFAEDCLIFVDEAQTTELNPADDSFYVVKSSELPNSVYIAGYDANDINEISCAVYYKGYGVSAGSATGSLYYYSPNCHVVESVMVSVNDEGTNGYNVSLVGNNKRSDYFVPVEKLKLYVADQNNETGWQKEYISIFQKNAEDFTTYIKSGDVIRFQTNSKGYITYIEKLFDFETHKDTLVNAPNAGGQIYGFTNIKKISGNTAIYTDNSGNEYLFKRRSTYTTVPVYHVNTKRVTLESFSDIPSASTGNTVKAFLRYYNYGDLYDHIFYVFD